MPMFLINAIYNFVAKTVKPGQEKKPALGKRYSGSA